MGKIDQKKLKIEKNEIYAKRFRKAAVDQSSSQDKGDRKKMGGKYGSWCRIAGHDPSCDCTHIDM